MQEVALSSTALLVWDHLVTLDLEVEHIWKAKKSLCEFARLPFCLIIGDGHNFLMNFSDDSLFHRS